LVDVLHQAGHAVALSFLFLPSVAFSALEKSRDPRLAMGDLWPRDPWQRLIHPTFGATPLSDLLRGSATPNLNAMVQSRLRGRGASVRADEVTKLLADEAERTRLTRLRTAEIVAYAGIAAELNEIGIVEADEARRHGEAKSEDDRLRLSNWRQVAELPADPDWNDEPWLRACRFVRTYEDTIRDVAMSFAARSLTTTRRLPAWCGIRHDNSAASPPTGWKALHPLPWERQENPLGDVLLRLVDPNGGVTGLAGKLLKPDGSPYSREHIQRVMTGKDRATPKLVRAVARFLGGLPKPEIDELLTCLDR
jgi:hypothetical protein